MAVQEQVFGFYIPTVTLMGIGAYKEIGKQIRTLGGKKPYICTDKGIVDSGILEKVVEVIRQDCEVEPVVYDKTKPNPTDNNVHEGLELYKQNGCDLIVSLGGGSAHDCGKGIGIVATNGGNIRDYEGVDQSSAAMPPFIAVNTTAGTASEMTRFCIITDTSRKVKMAIVDWRVTPNVAIDDPLLMVGMPPALTAATGMDALTHAIEGFTANASEPIADSAALYAIELIAAYLRAAVADGNNLEARAAMLLGSVLAGIAFSHSDVAAVHCVAEALGGKYDAPHGVCNAVVLPAVMAYNMEYCKERYARIATAMGLPEENVDQAARQAVKAVEKLASDVHLPEFNSLGVQKNDLEELAVNSFKNGSNMDNPRPMTKEDYLNLFQLLTD